MAARGLLEAGHALGDAALTAQGGGVLDWLLSEAVRGGRVLHMVDDPAVGELDLLSDYAALAAACVASHRVCGRESDKRSATTILNSVFDLFEAGGVLNMTRADTDLPVRPAAFDDVPAASGWVTILEVYRVIKPADDRFHQLFGPLVAFAVHAPQSAGAVLSLAAELTSDQG